MTKPCPSRARSLNRPFIRMLLKANSGKKKKGQSVREIWQRTSFLTKMKDYIKTGKIWFKKRSEVHVLKNEKNQSGLNWALLSLPPSCTRTWQVPWEIRSFSLAYCLESAPYSLLTGSNMMGHKAVPQKPLALVSVELKREQSACRTPPRSLRFLSSETQQHGNDRNVFLKIGKKGNNHK